MVLFHPENEQFGFHEFGWMYNAIVNSQKEVSNAYYNLHFQDGKIIEYPYFKIIETDIESGAFPIFDVFDDKFYKDEKMYYQVTEKIIKKCQKNKAILSNFAKSLMEKISLFSFKKNKILLNYQRTFAVCLFALFEGKISEMTLSKTS